MKHLALIGLFFISASSFSQSAISEETEEKLRSLRGQEKIVLLSEILKEIQFSKPWEAKRYAGLLMSEAQRIKSRFDEAKAWSYLSSIEGQEGEYLKAISYGSKAINLFKSLKRKREECTSLLQLGKFHRLLKDYKAGIRVLRQTEVLAKKENYLDILGNVYRYLGNIYYDKGDYKLSKNYQLKSMALEKMAGNPKGIAYTNHNLGLLFMRQKNYDSALHYMQGSLNYDIEQNNLGGLGVSYVAFTRLYLYKGDLVKAEKYANLAMQIADSVNADDTKATVYSLLPIIYSSKGDTETASLYTEKFLRFKEQLFEDRLTSKLTKVKLQHELEMQEEEAKIIEKFTIELNAISGLNKRYLYIIVGMSFLVLLFFIKLLSKKERVNENLSSSLSE